MGAQEGDRKGFVVIRPSGSDDRHPDSNTNVGRGSGEVVTVKGDPKASAGQVLRGYRKATGANA